MIGPIVAAALWAVLASLVLCVVLGVAVAGVVAFFRPAAATRQALWSIALGAAGLAPVIILAMMLYRGAHCSCDATTAMATLRAAKPIHVTVPAAKGDAKTPAHASYADTYTASDAVPAGRASALGLPNPPDVTPMVADAIVLVWALGALGGLIGLARSLARVRGLKLRSSPLDGDLATDLPWLTTTKGREIYLRLSYETETPIAVGFRRPVILIPTEMATADGLTSIEPLVMHEYAHLARYDDWTNLVQRAIERIFWFNPLVWILGRRIALEREVAADEAVVARTHDAKNYASALWRMAQEMRMPEHVVVAPGAMLTRKQISVRIERLLEEAPLGGRKFGAAGLVVAAFALTAVAAVAAGAPAVSLAQNDEAPIDAVSPAPHLIVLKRQVAGAPKPLPLPLPHVAAKPAAMAHPLILKRVVVADVPAVAAVTPVSPVAAVSPVAPVAPAQEAPPSPPDLPLATDRERVLKNAELQQLKELGPHISAQVQRELSDATSLEQLKELGPQISAQVHRELADNDTRSHHDRDRSSHGPMSRDLIANCMGCDFSHRDVRGLDLSGISLTGDDFSHANLANVNFANAKLQGVSFDHAILTNVNMQSAKLTGVDLSGAVMDNANLGNALLTGVDLSGASMNNVNTNGIHLIGSSLP